MFGRFWRRLFRSLIDMMAWQAPRNPLGILKALIVKRGRGIPSDRQLYKHLWSESELRRICDIEEHERPIIHPSFNVSENALAQKGLKSSLITS